METRVEKYNKSRLNANRLEKNKDLYKEVSKSNLEVTRSFNNNSKVIDTSNNEIDLDKIKRYIEKMNENTTTLKRTKINDIETPNYDIKDNEEEKDYDLNSVLEKAKNNREVDYQKERSKKVNIRYEELIKKLDEFNKRNSISEEEEELNTGERKIVDLFNTVKSSGEEIDLFDDLKPSENTELLGNITDMASDTSFKDEIKKQIKGTDFSDTYSKINTSTLTEEDKKSIFNTNTKLEQLDLVEEDDKTDTISDTSSFYTTSDIFDKSDFEDEWENEKPKPIKKILLILAIIVLLGILFVVANYVFDLGLFK